jgi:hypothetical protein
MLNLPFTTCARGDASRQHKMFSIDSTLRIAGTHFSHNGTLVGNTAWTGNGGAIASLPGSLLNIPERTIANTTLSVTSSTFHANAAVGDSGAIYLAASTATLEANSHAGNEAALENPFVRSVRWSMAA